MHNNQLVLSGNYLKWTRKDFLFNISIRPLPRYLDRNFFSTHVSIEIPRVLELRDTRKIDARLGGMPGALSLCNQQDLSVEPALEFNSPEGSNVHMCGNFHLKHCISLQDFRTLILAELRYITSNITKSQNSLRRIQLPCCFHLNTRTKMDLSTSVQWLTLQDCNAIVSPNRISQAVFRP